MSAYLDLDDVAAQSQLAARELATLKERIAELERSYSEFSDARRAWLASDNIKQSAIDRLRAEVEALTAANAALRADAERYRWLREQHWHSAQLFVVSGGKEAVKLGVQCPSQRCLDATIDTAIAARKGEGVAGA